MCVSRSFFSGSHGSWHICLLSWIFRGDGPWTWTWWHCKRWGRWDVGSWDWSLWALWILNVRCQSLFFADFLASMFSVETECWWFISLYPNVYDSGLAVRCCDSDMSYPSSASSQAKLWKWLSVSNNMKVKSASYGAGERENQLLASQTHHKLPRHFLHVLVLEASYRCHVTHIHIFLWSTHGWLVVHVVCFPNPLLGGGFI